LYTLHTFLCIFYLKGGDLQLTVFLVSAHVHILISWPDDDQSLGSKLVAV